MAVLLFPVFPDAEHPFEVGLILFDDQIHLRASDICPSDMDAFFFPQTFQGESCDYIFR